jgi:D-psicose/D-tagatose/L-ribulose 3-epimerase
MVAGPARLAVSNIAWDAADDDEIAAVLRRHGVHGIEIAPTKWRSDPIASTNADRAEYRRRWEDQDIEIVAMQALLFGQSERRLFGSDRQRFELAAYLRGIIGLGADFGAGALVFGSPKNRVRDGLGTAGALAIAADFFADVGAYAFSHGTTICIEANPAAYGCDWITTTAQAVEFCRLVDSPGIRLNADLGGMAMTGEELAPTISAAAPWLEHFHISEPHLAELAAASNHAGAAAALAAVGYDRWLSIEMRDAGPGNRRAAIERALRLVQSVY